MKSETQVFGKESWDTLLLLSTALFLLLGSLGVHSLWGSEGRWAEVTREMILTGDFFHPTIGGMPYFDKPFLTYWLIVLVSLITGTLNEWVVRLPGALSGIVVICATMSIGRRLWSVQTGKIAGWILLTTFGFLFWSRTASAETENLAAITLAIAWYLSRKNQPTFKAYFIFYLIIFVGALTKGLTAVVIPIIFILPDILENKRRDILFNPSHLLALIFAILIYLAPFLYASANSPADYHASGLRMVLQENIVRYFKPFDHREPVYTYLCALPQLLLPWVPLFVAALAGTIRNWRHLTYNTRWLAKGVLIIFIFFTASGSRRNYYILPVLPFCALLTAVFVTDFCHSRTPVLRRWGIGVQAALFFTVILLELAAPFMLVMLKEEITFSIPPAIFTATTIIALMALILSLFTYRLNRRFTLFPENRGVIPAFMVMATVLMGGYFCWQQNISEEYRTKRPFVREVKSRIASCRRAPIVFFPKIDPTMLFYLSTERPVRLLSTTPELKEFLDNNPQTVLVSQRRYINEIHAVYTYLQRYPSLEQKDEPFEKWSSEGKKWHVWFLGGC